jgi:hypothetical protein
MAFGNPSAGFGKNPNDQGAKSQSMTNDQAPMTKKRGIEFAVGTPSAFGIWSLELGIRLGFGSLVIGISQRDLAPWDLVIRAFRSHPTKPILVSSPPWLI